MRFVACVLYALAGVIAARRAFPHMGDGEFVYLVGSIALISTVAAVIV